MAFIEVGLDDFDTIELVEELVRRLDSKKRNFLSAKDLKRATAMMKDLSSALHVCVLPVDTIDDQSKRDVLLKYWPELTSCQFEEKLSK